jgi:hypothetical protein
MSYVNVSQRISRARQMDVRTLSAQQVAERMRIIMDDYRTMIIPVQLNGVFRARRNPDGDPFRSASELWYPPAKLIQRRGRFNSSGEPVFYASNRASGAVFEVRPAVGDMITLLIAATKEPFVELKCAHIGLDRSLAPELAEVQKNGIPRANQRFQAMLKHHGISKRWHQVDDFLAEMATMLFSPDEEEDKYKITNGISDVMFKIAGIDALNYPSVATQLECVNLCLKPAVADRLFKPSEAWMIRIEERADHPPGLKEKPTDVFYRTTFVRRSEEINENGNIHWSDVLKDVTPEDIAHLAYRPHPEGFK